MTFRVIAMVLLMILLALTVSGCQEKAELSQLAMIVGLGIDQAEEGGLRLTVELAHRRSMEEPGESMVLSATGRDLAEAEGELQRMLDKQPYWSNAVLLVLGQSMAGEAAVEQLRAIYQDSRFDPGLLAAVAAGEAEEALNADFGESDYTAQGLAETLNRMATERGAKALTVARAVERELNGIDGISMPLLTVEDGSAQISHSGLSGGAVEARDE